MFHYPHDVHNRREVEAHHHHVLGYGPMRFGRLGIYIPVISNKILTEQLRELEEDGIITRKKYNESPPRVEYSLSEKGRSLVPILNQLSQWCEVNLPHLDLETCHLETDAL
ncbi:winged helix-turn-helix transcriptional regulator [Roseivirga sp. BDSF3-8]|uniref:winged helix-turn-helix transcriptional regulator n=1 Tax=Roseivirga sp. BDSF3-8 TaxID=3241598 RepID=UPI003531B5E0